MKNILQCKTCLFKIFFCFLLVILFSSTQRVYGQQDDSEETKKAQNVAHAEDYESEEYMTSLNQMLEHKLNHSYQTSKDWALIGLVIEHNGKIPQAWICTSSGNETLNEEAINSLKKSQFPALEEGSPASVKVFYHVNWQEAQRAAAKESRRTGNAPARAKTEEAQFDEEIQKAFKNPNVEALGNIMINGALIIGILVFASLYQVLFGFFIAGFYWWAHRLFMGRFPA